MDGLDVSLDSAAWAMVVLGVVLFFVGSRINRVVFAAVGFAGGAYGVCWATSAWLGGGEAPVAAWVGGGLVVALLFAWVRPIGAFILGGLVSVMVAFAILTGRGMTEVSWPFVAVLGASGAVLAAGIAVWFPMMSFLMTSAFLGAWGVLRGGEYLVFGRGAEAENLLTFVRPDADLARPIHQWVA